MRRFRIIFGLVLLASCGGSSEETDFDLCGCQVWDRGQRDMSLSEKCVEACLEKFGPNLEGMEAWFEEHCNPMDAKPDTREIMASN